MNCIRRYTNYIDLSRKLNEIDNPRDLFLTFLIEQDRISKLILENPSVSPSLIEKWIFYQFLLEQICNLKLDLTPDDDDEDVFSIEKYGSLNPSIKKAIFFDRLIKDVTNGKIIFAYSGQNPSLIKPYLTTKKWLWDTPELIFNAIFQRFPCFHKNLTLDFRGFEANILSDQIPHMQNLNMGAKIWTNLIHISNTNPLEDIDPNYEEYVITWLYRVNEAHEDNDYRDLRLSHFVENHVIEILNFQDIALKSFAKLAEMFYYQKHHTGRIDTTLFETESQENFKYLLEKFNPAGNLRTILYFVGERVYTSLYTLQLFQLLLENYHYIQRPEKKQKRKDVAKYRGQFKLEQQVWHLGTQLNIDNFFPDGEQMLNLDDIPGDEGTFEVDVLYYSKGTLELIECKSDIAINPLMQENYYRKLSKKESFVKKYCEQRGYTISMVHKVIFAYICGKEPPQDIDFFLSEFHFLEYCIHHYGLYAWHGEHTFDEYPILARIGWSNSFIKKEGPINLKAILSESDYLIRGEYDEGVISFFNPINEEQIQHSIQNLEEDVNWNDLEVILIWDCQSSLLKDYIFLPPYQFEPYSDDSWISKSRGYHASKEGQRFLYIGILNGIFGYCENCKYIPLVPRGGFSSKPFDESAKGFCVRCNNEFDLSAFDGVSFDQYSDLEEKVKDSLKIRFPFLFSS